MTGWVLTPETASLDHIVPISRGGEHVMGNLQWLHRDVNDAKRTRTVDEFMDLCRAVAGPSESS